MYLYVCFDEEVFSKGKKTSPDWYRSNPFYARKVWVRGFLPIKSPVKSVLISFDFF